MKPGGSPWDAIGDAISHLIEESGKLVQPMSEPENVLKSKFLASLFYRLPLTLLLSHRYCPLGRPNC